MYIKFDEDWSILQGIVNCIKIVCILNYNMKYHYGNTKFKGQKKLSKWEFICLKVCLKQYLGSFSLYLGQDYDYLSYNQTERYKYSHSKNLDAHFTLSSHTETL